jgi:hypothetical protein
MQERLEVARALHKLAESQAAAARSSDINLTLGILARKQSLLEELAVVQARLTPYFEDVPEDRLWASPLRRQVCRQIAEEGSQLLHASMRIDQSAIDELSSRREAVAAQLQAGQDSILASSAYTAGELLCTSALDIADL